MKPTTKVFSSPQKMDPGVPAKQQKVLTAAMQSNRKHMGGGASAKTVQAHAMRGPKSR